MAAAQDCDLQPVMLDDLAATEALARTVAGAARPGDVIALIGPLGAGKTAFSRAFIRETARLAGNADFVDEVPSPTFTLVQPYEFADRTVCHADLYRLKSPSEAAELGLFDAYADAVLLIEWPDRLGGAMPADRLEIRLDPGPHADARVARIARFGSWCARLSQGRHRG